MKKWIEIKLKQCGNIITGKTPPTEDVNNFGTDYMFITPVELGENKFIIKAERYLSIRGSRHSYKIPEKSICVSCIGYIGKIGITKTEACTNQQINTLIPNENYDFDFLYYLLQYHSKYFKELAATNVVPQLNKSDFAKLKFKVPSEKIEQKTISHILSKVDEVIEATKKSISKAERLKKSLMQNLLSGKINLDGSWREKKEFYNHEKFGNSPVGWHWGRLSEIADVIAGQSPAGEYYNDEGKGMPMLNGPTEFTDHHPIPVQYTTKTTKLCEVGDILFTVRGSSTGRMNIADQTYCIGRGIAAIRNKEGSDIDFIYYILITIAEKILAEARGSGTTFPNISRRELLKKWVLIPESGQEEIAKKIKSIDAILKSKQIKIKKLERIKKALMQNLLTGKVRVQINKTANG